MLFINYKKEANYMQANIDQSGCIGCGLCTQECPEIFTLNQDNVAQVASGEIPPALLSKAEKARDACPVSVIDITQGE